MKKQTSTKRALITSALSVLMCGSMLVGTTFAWFTDTVTSGSNKIVAGNLDIELEKKSSTDVEWTSAKDAQLFRDGFDDLLWEPGMMEVSDAFRLKNAGTLNLWYSLTSNVTETSYTWPEKSVYEGKTVKLSDVIKMAIVDAEKYEEAIEGGKPATYDERVALWNELTGGGETTTDFVSDFSQTGEIAPGKYANEKENGEVIILFWQEKGTEDNEYNLNNGVTKEEDDLTISNFGLNVYATQTPAENDSFGKDYDETAKGGAIYTAMDEAVAKKVEELKASNVDISLSVNDKGNPQLDVKPTTPEESSANPESVETAYNAVKEAISEALTDEQENISKISIGGFVPTGYDQDSLQDAFGDYLESIIGGNKVNDLAKYLKDNDYNINIPVTVSSTDGAVVKYEVVISAEAYKDIIEKFVG